MNELNLDERRLFFVIGLGRSGTTLFQTLMNTFVGFCNRHEARNRSGGISCYSFVIKNNDFSYLENFIQTHWTKKYFVEKTPNSVLCLPQLFQKYPNANYLFLERHPLKILLSQMNYSPPGKKDEELRKLWLIQGNITKDDLKLNYEQFKAKQLLKWIKIQFSNKDKFKNKLTIKYEDLLVNLESNISNIGKTFQISPNFDQAKKALTIKSYSSRNNKYAITELKDDKAIEMTKESCQLWGYNYKDGDS